MLGTPSTTVVTVVNTDGPGAVQFDTSNVSAASGTTSVSLQVDRINGKSGTISVHYATSAGSAKPGVDFTTTSGTLTFAPGVVSKTITIPVENTSALGLGRLVQRRAQCANRRSDRGRRLDGRREYPARWWWWRLGDPAPDRHGASHGHKHSARDRPAGH